MVGLQILSKVILSKDYSLIEDNLLTKEYFPDYPEVFDFIDTHYRKYNQVPDELTVLNHFKDTMPDLQFVEVEESDSYLIDTIREEHLYSEFVPVIQKAASLLKSDSNEAAEYLINEMKNLQPTYEIQSVSIKESASERLGSVMSVVNDADSEFIPTGFDAIDLDIRGFKRGNELVVLFARTNQGKSWVLEKMCEGMASAGFVVGYFSPEMSVNDIGYRFDTLHGHVPNTSISFGYFDNIFTVQDYENYINSLELSGDILVTTPKDFNRKVTVSKLRNWIKSDNLDAVAIDGITYLTDERYKRGDSKTISLTNISEDLMDLSEEMKVPILVVVQANRGGVVDKESLDTPELENIRDSDGIAQNASLVYSIRQKSLKDESLPTLIIENKKTRIGRVGMSYLYTWDINNGTFELTDADSVKTERTKQTKDSEPRKRQKKVQEDVF